ncbi:hypothetical protein J4416_00355 [Candidatus Pacearchaeota archaeon]|nr:hypothetical protein [Candidatus Pacearchaeota archaeon]
MDYLDLRPYDESSYVEAIKDGEIIRVPENVAILEDLFILRKINNPPLQQDVPARGVSIKQQEASSKGSIISEWKHGKFGGKKNNVLQDLVPNFNWEISKNRKSHNLTRAKLAQMINSTEEDVKMMELGELPADDFVLISRVEQAFAINLRKHPDSIAQVNLAELQKRNEQAKKETATRSVGQMFKDSASVSGNDIEVIED